MKFDCKSLKQNGFVAFLATLIVMFGFVATQQASAQSTESGDRKVKVRVSPIYPELARHTQISGTVKLEAVVAASGTVKSVKVIGGHPLLAGAAEDALKKWKYEPGTSETTTVVEFKFNPGM